jgi:hypothetical protein
LIITADVLGRVQTGITMLLEELKEIFPARKVQLAWLHRLRRQLIRPACNNRVQAENFSGSCNPQDEGFSISGSGRKLGLPLAKHEDATRGLSFNKNDSAFGKNGGMFYLVESCQRFLGEGAEEIPGAQVTGQTVLNAGQTVGRLHGCSYLPERRRVPLEVLSNDLWDDEY